MDALSSVFILAVIALLVGLLGGGLVRSFLPAKLLGVVFVGLILGLMAVAVIAGRLFGSYGQGS